MSSKKSKKPNKKSSKKPVAQLNVSYIFTDNTVTVNYPEKVNGKVEYKTKVANKGTKEYDIVKEAIKSGKVNELPKLLLSQAEEKLNKFPEKFIALRDGAIYIDNLPVPVDLTERILAYANDGLPYMPLVLFVRNLRKNTSFRAINGLFRFLSVNHFPISSNGCFIAYKGVTEDFKDLRTKTFDNSIGKTVKVLRNQVDENPEHACSNGLHISNFSYVSRLYGGQRKIEVEVNPKDVVAVPYDDNSQKMRVCEYRVIGECSIERTEQLYNEPENNASSSSNTVNSEDYDDAYSLDDDEYVDY